MVRSKDSVNDIKLSDRNYHCFAASVAPLGAVQTGNRNEVR